MRRHRQTGAALLTALMISVATAMLLAASLTVLMSSSQLAWAQADAEAAIQIADAGINSELQYIAMNQSQSLLTLRSSQPVAAIGVTLEYPTENFPIKGRNGTVTGYSSGQFWVYSSNDAAGNTAWDGVTSPFYITSSGYVNNKWQRVQVTTTTASLFNLYGTFVTGSYTSNPTGVSLNTGSSVVVTGPAGINGQVSSGSGTSFTAPQAINANTCTYSSGQFTNNNVQSGGKLCSVSTPFVYPTCASIIRNQCGQPSYTDAQAWSWRSTNCCNSSCVYTYRSNANSSTISPSNCQKCTFNSTVLNNSCWNNANTEPGTYTSSGYWWWWGWTNSTVAVQTLIFEPGDYYFTSVQLAYDASCQMIVDPQAQACGGTPGQVRFWVYDPGTNPTNDSIALPITNTCASGQTSADPGMFRIYYGKDSCQCTFQRPTSCTDWQGNTITGDFEYTCGVYACSKLPTTTVSSTGGCQAVAEDTTKKGCCVHLQGCSSRSSGCAKITGSCLCDKLSCDGGCTLNYKASSYCGNDPCAGGTVTSWCKK